MEVVIVSLLSPSERLKMYGNRKMPGVIAPCLETSASVAGTGGEAANPVARLSITEAGWAMMGTDRCYPILFLTTNLIKEKEFYMLVLGRYQGERIIMTLPDGQEIEVKVLKTGPGQTKLGIEAPDNVAISRSGSGRKKIVNVKQLVKAA